MSSGHLMIGFDFALARREDLLREAARCRLAAEVARQRPAAVGVLRRRLGAALVRAGERLQGASRPAPAGDVISAAALRSAR